MRLPLFLTVLLVGLGLALSARVAAADPVAPADTPTTPGLLDPQLDATGGTFPPLGGSLDDSTVLQHPATAVDPDAAAALRLRELSDNDSPMAPLPPAIVAGPIGIALAGWMAHRANRRGGRI
jgi:hypothetical protein